MAYAGAAVVPGPVSCGPGPGTAARPPETRRRRVGSGSEVSRFPQPTTNMGTTFTPLHTALTAVLGLLAALALTLSVTGCGTTADATTTVPGPTQASALKVFHAYVTARRVAVANHDALLAASLTSSSQYSLVST